MEGADWGSVFRGLRYCLIHGPGAGDPGAAGDLDFVFAPSDLRAAEQRLLAAPGWRVVQLIRHESSAYYFVLAAERGGDGVDFAAVDIATDYRRDGRVFFTAAKLLAERTASGDLWVSSPRAELAYLLAKKLSKGAVPARQRLRLATLAGEPGGAAAAEASELLGPRWGARVSGRIADGDWAALEADAPRAARHARLRLLLRDPLNPLRYWLPEARRLWRRLRFPTGLLVAVVGPDGAGKSTLVRELARLLAPAFRRVDRFHLFPGILRRRRVTGLAVTEPHGLPARGPMGSLLKAAYYLLQYTLGFLLRVRPLLVRSSLVLFDRYCDDLRVDPLRHRYGGPPGLLRLVASLAPRPDLLLILDVPEDRLAARKRELPAEELSRQRAAYRALARRAPAVVLDGGSCPREVARRAADAVLARMRERYQARRRAWPGVREPGTLEWLSAVIGVKPARVSGLRFRRLALSGGREYLLPAGRRRAATSLRALSSPRGLRGRVQLAAAVARAPIVRVGEERPDERAVLNRLRSLFAPIDVSFAVAAGTPGAHRKPVIQVLDGRGRPLAYCKVGWNAATSALARNEAAALAWLQRASPRSFVAPALLHAGAWGSSYLCVQAALVAPPAQATPAPARLGDLYIEAERELASFCSGREPLEASAAWKRLSRRAAGLQRGYGSLVRDALSAASARVGAAPLLFHASHGDFCPWNASMARAGSVDRSVDGSGGRLGRLRLFDWEYASGLRPAGWDLWHLALQTMWLVERRSPEQAHARLGPDGSEGAMIRRHLAGLGLAHAACGATLLLYLADRLAWWAAQPADPRGALPLLARMIRLALAEEDAAP